MTEQACKDIHIVKANENSYIIYFSQKISPQVLSTVRYFCHIIKAQKTHAFTQVIPAYNNVLVSYKKQTLSTRTMVDFLYHLIHQCFEKHHCSEREENLNTHYLPAYYHSEVGMDIETVLKHCQLSSLEQLIELHCSKIYTVYAVGFCPGFAYLAEVTKQLSIPRHRKPRLTVPAGSIAIAETQTAVYPIASPGGWHIIGHCPLSLSPNKDNLDTLWQIGDKVIFEPIERKMYQKLQATSIHDGTMAKR